MRKQADALKVCPIPDACLLVMAQRPARLLGSPETRSLIFLIKNSPDQVEGYLDYLQTTPISFCTNMSSMVLGAMLLMKLVCCIRCAFVFVSFLLVTGFHRDARRGIPVFWKTWKIASWRGDEHLQHTPSSVWCKELSGVGPKIACVAAITCCHMWGAWSVRNFVFL
jgi:hypothetical protein